MHPAGQPGRQSPQPPHTRLAVPEPSLRPTQPHLSASRCTRLPSSGGSPSSRLMCRLRRTMRVSAPTPGGSTRSLLAFCRVGVGGGGWQGGRKRTGDEGGLQGRTRRAAAPAACLRSAAAVWEGWWVRKLRTWLELAARRGPRRDAQLRCPVLPVLPAAPSATQHGPTPTGADPGAHQRQPGQRGAGADLGRQQGHVIAAGGRMGGLRGARQGGLAAACKRSSRSAAAAAPAAVAGSSQQHQQRRQRQPGSPPRPGQGGGPACR